MAGSEGLQTPGSHCWGLHPYTYLTGVGKRDKALQALGGSLKARFLHEDHSYLGGLAVFWGFSDQTSAKMVRCMKEKRPFIHLDHAYFKRGYEHGNVRVNFGHFHQTGLLKVQGDRSGLGMKRLLPWQKEGKHIVIISPSDNIVKILRQMRDIPPSAKDWCRKMEIEVKTISKRPVVVKEKGGSILDVLMGAHAVVSLSSVAEVEAAVHGIPVFVSQDSPAYPMSGELSQIENPVYPDRSDWINTLSYSQFHLSELSDGTARKIIEELYGSEHLFRTEG
jgi:predicted alpha/beta hydrolase family esterase